jgi:hypothetical protein
MLVANINANHVQMKIMPNEILRIYSKLREFRAGNISSNDMFGPIISPKSILSVRDELPKAI